MAVVPDRVIASDNKPFGTSPAIVVTLYVLIVEIYYLVLAGSTSSPLDEGLTILLLPFALYAIITSRQFWLPTLAFSGYFGISLLGVVVYHYGGIPQPRAGIVDLLSDLKILVLVAGFFQLLRMGSKAERGLDIVCVVIIGLALINSFFAMHDMVSNGTGILGEALEKRGMFFQPQGFQSHKVRSAELTVLGAAFAWSRFREHRSLSTLMIALALSIMVAAHQSAKEIIAFFIIMLVMSPGGRVKGLRPIIVMLSTVAGIAVLFATPLGNAVTNRVSMFTGDLGQDKARTLLLTRSLDIAYDKFPIGTGAGTYASSSSYQMGYSNVYVDYGLYRVWGISPENPSFIQDAFWAKIIGQSGAFGTLLYAAFLFCLILAPLRLSSRRQDGVAFPVLSTVILALIVSTASSPFSDDFLGVLLSYFIANAMYLLSQQRAERRFKLTR